MRIYRPIVKLITPSPVDRRTFYTRLFIVVALSLVVYQFEDNVLVTLSASLDKRIYWRTGDIADRGDYATFMLTHELAGEQPVRLTKQLVCFQGDTINYKERVHYCNDRPLGHVKAIGLNGQPLPVFHFQGQIPDGMAFAYGEHKDSFDSRYWGFVPIESTEQVKPVF